MILLFLISLLTVGIVIGYVVGRDQYYRGYKSYKDAYEELKDKINEFDID